MRSPRGRHPHRHLPGGRESAVVPPRDAEQALRERYRSRMQAARALPPLPPEHDRHIQWVEHSRKPVLTARQRALARNMPVEAEAEETPFTPLTPPTPENLALMPTFGRARVTTPSSVTVPIPPQSPEAKGPGSFTDFDKEDAEQLARELRKLKGEPVILTGGGGAGAQLMFLQDVKVVGWPEGITGSDGRYVRAKHPTPDIWYETDRSKPIKYYSVKVALDNPYAKESMFTRDHPTFDPWMGSWRVTALRGHGAERLSKSWRPGWEE